MWTNPPWHHHSSTQAPKTPPTLRLLTPDNSHVTGANCRSQKINLKRTLQNWCDMSSFTVTVPLYNVWYAYLAPIFHFHSDVKFSRLMCVMQNNRIYFFTVVLRINITNLFYPYTIKTSIDYYVVTPFGRLFAFRWTACNFSSNFNCSG